MDRRQAIEPMAGRADTSFELIYRAHFRFVFRTLSSTLGPACADVEDLVQEVFTVAYRKLPQYDGNCRMTTWLYGICWRVASQHRRRSRLRWLFSRQAADQPADDSQAVTPEDQLAADNARAMVYRVLDRLGRTKRQVLILYELEGYSGAEIAELVGCSQGTVWTRLHKAREDFKKQYAQLSFLEGNRQKLARSRPKKEMAR